MNNDQYVALLKNVFRNCFRAYIRALGLEINSRDKYIVYESKYYSSPQEMPLYMYAI